MYKCQLCGTQVARSVRQKRLVARRRAKVYSQHWMSSRNSDSKKERYQWRNLPRSKDGGRRNGKPRFIEILVPDHTGWEIAQELHVCLACFKISS